MKWNEQAYIKKGIKAAEKDTEQISFLDYSIVGRVPTGTSFVPSHIDCSFPSHKTNPEARSAEASPTPIQTKQISPPQ